jgi:alpha-2-macroglobulin
MKRRMNMRTHFFLTPPSLRRTLIAAMLTAATLTPPVVAANTPKPVPLQNHRSPFVGEPFFLLSDATYGSGDLAKVRIEVNNPQMLEQAGGIDVLVYRVPEPLAFLQRQKDLHRVQVEARPTDEGLANTLTHVWDNWVVKSRLSWQKLFSSNARQAVTQQAPDLKTPKALTKPSTFEEPTQFKPIAGLPVVERFRYPVQSAKPIEPPKDLKLAGSSSEFINPSQGNVFVPIGKRAPGLYLVEAIAGQHRATTLLFVSDTVALTKVSGEQMLVWSANRATGAPVPSTRVVWTDGVGLLKSGAADAQGVARLDRKSPEQTYVMGEDPSGGVFISENFYYDSEIYAAKVYTVTDRPLYRPGDWVQLKVAAREFKNARQSVTLKDADMGVTVLDPAGQVIATQSIRFSGTQGADTRFALPENAAAGGYELRMTMGDDTYTAAFRVADYQKPHFEIGLVLDKNDFTAGETISGKLQLNYPDGKPVANARVSLTARAQKLTMVDGELDYTGQFPLKLTQDELQTDGSGIAKFSLPASDQPSRYVLTALATDGAAYRVRTSKEILVERGSGSYKLSPDKQFSKPGEAVSFRMSASLRGNTSVELTKPAKWEWVRLENRAKESGNMPVGDALSLSFPQPGSYTLTLRDEKGRIVAATSHWVSGDGLKAPAGSIGMVFNRARYKAGDTAEVLVSFPEPIDNALLSLERDRVEATALLGQRTDWIRSERVAPTQWKLTLPVREEMSPNMTLSVAYVKNGDYVFQNQGVMVEQPRIVVSFKADKAVYLPGETVNVDVSTVLDGKPVAADVTVGVVDEMIYVLQPEIAPTIDDFFFHPRRNNVRTSASLSFIGYDLATSKLGDVPSRSQVNQRAVKVLERPRRDNIDTALWLPRLSTDASGKARFSFTMPDSLTRWRITGRAMDANGSVGQQVGWVRSDKPFYAKWTSPDWQREGDKAQASIALFNQTGKDAKVEWEAKGAGVDRKETVSVVPGANFVALPLAVAQVGASNVSLTLKQDGRVIDRLETPVSSLPVAWRSPRELAIDMSSGSAALKLPADATRVRVSFAQDAAAGEFNRWMEDLVEFPYGCVEQTASRMLPLSIALQSLSPAQQSVAPVLTQRLSTARLSLAQMAGPQAQFGWWGRDMSSDAFLTGYAYYADWRATQALRTTLPDEHWQRLLEVYAKEGVKLPPLQRAMVLSWMQEMGLPVGSQLSALLEQLQAQDASDAAQLAKHRGSYVMVDGGEVNTRDMALVLAVNTAGLAKTNVSAEQRAAADAAAARLTPIESPMVQSLLMMSKRVGPEKAPAVLSQVRADVPTFDRAQTLMWLQRALGGRPQARAEVASLPAPWKRAASAHGEAVWQLPAGANLPANLALPAGSKAAWAFVSYESSEQQASALPASIERTLWRVVPQAKASAKKPASAPKGSQPAAEAPSSDGRMDAKLELVQPGTPLDTNSLYLDQIKVTANRGMRWALVDAALPPGAAVESSTWGIDLESGGTSQPLERAQHQPTAQGYAVPLEKIGAGNAVTFRHLVRFSQRGQFKLPPTRMHRMYEPDAKAFDTSGRWASVEVR